MTLRPLTRPQNARTTRAAMGDHDDHARQEHPAE